MTPFFKQGVQWHLTEVCPNRCKHCYIGDSSNDSRVIQELSFKEILLILDNLSRFEEKMNVSIDDFALTGGDPFSYADFPRVLEELTKRGKRIQILGIPERINPSSVAFLEKYNVNVYQVSLDGMPSTHDDIRGPGSFHRTIHALQELSHSQTIFSYVMFTVHNRNFDQIFPLIDYLDNLDIRISFSFDFLVFEGEAKKNFSPLSKDQVNILLREYRKKKIELRAQHRKLILREKSNLFNCFDIENASQKFKDYSYVSGCSCGITGITILADGTIYPCRRLPIAIGNLLHDEYSKLFLNNEMLRKLRRISSFEGCNGCDFAKVCRGCPALTYSLTGDPFAHMPYCSTEVRTQVPYIEPSLNCSENEEYEYLLNTFESRLISKGIRDNKEGLLYRIYKNFT